MVRNTLQGTNHPKACTVQWCAVTFINILFPQYMNNLIKPYSCSRSLRSSTKSLLVVPKWKLAFYGRRSFSVAAPELWNKLRSDIKTSPNVITFKRRLKTYFFSRAFSIWFSATERCFELWILGAIQVIWLIDWWSYYHRLQGTKIYPHCRR